MLRQARHAEEGKATLPRAEHLAAASELQILLGNDEAVLGAAHDAKPLACRVGERLAVKQNTRGLLGAAPDAPAQLMELRETEALGVLDDHDAGIRYVDADLDHRGGDEDRQRASGKLRHDAVLVLTLKLAVHEADLAAKASTQLGMARPCRG